MRKTNGRETRNKRRNENGSLHLLEERRPRLTDRIHHSGGGVLAGSLIFLLSEDGGSLPSLP